MRVTLKILIIVEFLLPLSVFAQNWQLVWSDEFDGSVLDETVWTRETGGDGWGNNELEFYTDRTVNSYLQNGILVIKALKENFGGRNYTSARLKSQNKKFFKYGKMEARIKLPFGQGLWPAFWMLGQNFPSVGWPACGEIDIMEMIGGPNDDNRVYGTAHWEQNGHAQYGGNYALGSGIFADDFHVFTIIWNQQDIKWYVDNIQYHIINITPQPLSEFHKDFFFILNVAVGGNWPGNPDLTTQFPQTMELDYVRVYQQVTDAVDDSDIPVQFELFQNYPNPFNPTTSINFNLPVKANVNLAVYNLLGQKVLTIAQGEFESGRHVLNVNASDLSSGIYIYTLTTSGLSGNKFITSKKMTLLK